MSFENWKDNITDFRKVDVRGIAGNFFLGLKKQAMEIPMGSGIEVVQTFEPLPLYNSRNLKGLFIKSLTLFR